jgi:allene oxide cyclase
MRGGQRQRGDLVSDREMDGGRKEGEAVGHGGGLGVLVLAVALAVVLACGCGVRAAASSAKSSEEKSTTTIHVIEHADTDTTIDVGKKGDSTGDILTFHNKVFDKQDEKKVGTDLGRCIRVEAGRSYECAWTTVLHDGQIMVEGPFYDNRDSVLAITGGTGAYKRARGEMLLRSRKGGTEFDFVFKLAG